MDRELPSKHTPNMSLEEPLNRSVPGPHVVSCVGVFVRLRLYVFTYESESPANCIRGKATMQPRELVLSTECVWVLVTP